MPRRSMTAAAWRRSGAGPTFFQEVLDHIDLDIAFGQQAAASFWGRRTSAASTPHSVLWPCTAPDWVVN